MYKSKLANNPMRNEVKISKNNSDKENMPNIISVYQSGKFEDECSGRQNFIKRDLGRTHDDNKNNLSSQLLPTAI